MSAFLTALWLDDTGQDLVEYSLLVSLIAIVVIAALRALGPQIASLFNGIGEEMNGLGGSGAEPTCCD